MGRRLTGVAARQHPDLTTPVAPGSDRYRIVLWILLGLDGVLSALMAVFFLPLRIGVVPFPISALLSGVLNAALVWVALRWTTSPRLAAIPLWAWLATVLVLMSFGPGDDIVFGGTGVMEFGPVLLVALGGLPGAWLLMRPPGSASKAEVTTVAAMSGGQAHSVSNSETRG
ncbi:hypothetical protein [Mycolicibacterium parafortuitum]|uniref:hypothetical protein n=1 Tax=Mycolicibacterium parafortuitum TaxID=39692 RepID=UPI001E45C73F|nr:hypothetical protein [Mycolicibacterium parafortuitum]